MTLHLTRWTRSKIPTGWHKVLKLDSSCGVSDSEVLFVQANHELELFFILTTRSIHVWFSRPTVEIVSHKRSQDSIDRIGFNKTAIWRTNSSVIVVATTQDQLLFYQLRRRPSPSSASSFLLPGASRDDSIYNLQRETKNIKNILLKEICLDTESQSDIIPALTVFSFGKLDLSSIGVSCLMSAEEEIIVGARNGNIYGIHWDGSVDDQFPWSLSKYVKKGSDYVVDLKFSSILSGFALVFYSGRVGFMPSELKGNKQKLENGISSNETSGRSKVETTINYLENITDAVIIEINHKYRLIAIGLGSSKVVVCNVDDSTSTLVRNHDLELKPDVFPHITKKLGKVTCMRYSPDNFALALGWEGGDLAVWSVFGSLLFCTRQWQLGHPNTDELVNSYLFTSLAWGREGYTLWLVVNTQQDSLEQVSLTGSSSSSSLLQQDSLDSKTSSRPTYPRNEQKEEILIMSFARSSLSSSPHLTCSSDAIILMSQDRLYIGPSVPHKDKFDHWSVIDVPSKYLSTNWPLRYVTADRACFNIAVAGNTGFAINSIETGTWHYFTKKAHEENFSVCGDIIWWNNYLVLSCLNLVNEVFEIRAYPSDRSLSNDHFIIQVIPMEVVRMSIFENRLLVLYCDGTLGMFMLNLKRISNKTKKQNRSKLNSNTVISESLDEQNHLSDSTRSIHSSSTVTVNYSSKKKSFLNQEFTLQIAPIENLVISNLQANAYCISSIALTRLHFKNNRLDDSILLNACGKLFLLEREIQPDLVPSSRNVDPSTADLECLSLNSNIYNPKELNLKIPPAKAGIQNSIHFTSSSLKSATDETSALTNVTFKAVSVIATNVEQFWISPEISSASDMSYFRKSLWLSCGGLNNYFQVWLPLLNDKNDPPTDLYVPDRIMLPIRCDIYPLAIRSSAPDTSQQDDAFVLGAESDILYKDSNLFSRFPYCTVKRQCRVYLHRILRELLLDRHLGYYARKIAESCQSLPYFAHCFELLLHEVLEEEATSSVPRPDPMLPQVVRFIKEFPVYLETVVHCARKSELSMWSHLFDERAVGNPRRLFQECLERHKLDIAASCLIILQSLDRNIVSQRMIKELIKAAKDDPKFNYLIEDLENFLCRAEVDYNNISGSGSPNSL